MIDDEEKMRLNSESLDSLLGPDEPDATFHDAVFSAIHVDYGAARFVARVHLCAGSPNASDETGRERRREGELVVEGLTLWALEPPQSIDFDVRDGLWLSADGPLSESLTAPGKALAQSFASIGLGWFLYFSNMNAYGFVAGECATFRWL
jgi:hypothetical protein